MFNKSRWAKKCTVTPLFYICCYGAFLFMIDNVNTAYKHTMNVIDSLKRNGVEILIQQPRVIRESETPEELDVVKEYNQPDRLHYSDWRNIQFKVNNREEAEKVSFARRYLGINGCSFDTGAGYGSMDWEIDWSFKFTGIEEDKEHEDFDTVMQNFSLNCGL
jgi:hypothetical protein